ncbi:hypothetical protein CHY_0874 [Carboxydothermus hydrogenoformans Z-2901]|uniref:Uncharacterized protein n=1 Tax=Carboxydothermus hydrogenoformans (strain ATCC BAA-161 / DSM 6008 / Z-2901) TaxID=246194 RepID=Q3ADQ9_CARHZ|nr:hypothetical protein CHY_0874 [Carboxydothermus hydrogenoformans Z-2901]
MVKYFNKTDLNVTLNFCLGHDIPFTRESQAPTLHNL